MNRWFLTGLLVGVLLLGGSPFLRRYNERVREVRRDTATVAYFMRVDVWTMCSFGGATLILLSVIGIWRLRGTRGRFAQKKAILPVLPPFVFVVFQGVKGALGVIFAPAIYDTSALPAADPISQGVYHKLTIIVPLVFVALFGGFVWRAARMIRGQSSDMPRCQECGYPMVGLEERRCPECGTPFEPPIPQAEDDRSASS
jgi:hypothetical protein